MATKDTIKDVLFTPQDVQMVTKIFWPSTYYGIKGKRSYQKKDNVYMPELGIHYGTSHALPSMQLSDIEKGLGVVIKL
eukprot:jgi/Psemu1/12049/gm1.12049_g